MTISEAINKVLDLARAEIGYHEKASNSQLDDKTANSGSGNWTKYARDIDALGVTWGRKNGFAYCAEWCLWIFYKIFGIDLALAMLCSPNPTGIPVCSYGVSYFKSAGRWFTSNPQAGDIIFFQSSGVISHQGIIEKVSGNIITTIEGNTSDMVARRTYVIGDEYILGYGRPKWELAADLSGISTSVKPTLRYGDRNSFVKELQESLIKLGYYCGPYGADGDFGSGTLAAVKNFQNANGLEVDGIVGNITWGKIDSMISDSAQPEQGATHSDVQKPIDTDNCKSDEEAIWDRLYSYIGNAYGTAGAEGNLYAESALRSNNVQDSCEKRLGMNDVQYTAAVDNGSYGNFVHDSVGYGLYQATYWSIKQHLLNFAKTHGKSIGDRSMQVDAFVDILKTSYPNVWNTLKNATSVRQASDVVLLKFERPANQSEAVQVARASFGQKFYDKYAGKGTTAIINDTPATGSQKPMLRRGSVGSSVKELQERLIELGYSCGSCGADGEFGNDTYEAVRRFQEANGLEVDGIVGPMTWAKLQEVASS